MAKRDQEKHILCREFKNLQLRIYMIWLQINIRSLNQSSHYHSLKSILEKLLICWTIKQNCKFLRTRTIKYKFEVLKNVIVQMKMNWTKLLNMVTQLEQQKQPKQTIQAHDLMLSVKLRSETKLKMKLESF